MQEVVGGNQPVEDLTVVGSVDDVEHRVAVRLDGHDRHIARGHQPTNTSTRLQFKTIDGHGFLQTRDCDLDVIPSNSPRGSRVLVSVETDLTFRAP